MKTSESRRRMARTIGDWPKSSATMTPTTFSASTRTSVQRSQSSRRTRAKICGENVMPAKRFNSIRDTAAERWSRLYADVRASYGRASIQSALLLNGGASIALLAFLGNLAIAQQSKGLAGSFSTLKESFVCFGVGVMLAASSNVVAFLIQIFSIAHPEDAEGRTGRQLRFVGIGMVVTSLLLFAADQRGGKRVEQCDRIVGCDHSTVT